MDLICFYRISSIKRLPRINANKRQVSIKRRVKRKGVAMSSWCDSCSIASARHQPVSRVPDVGEAQAIVYDEAAGCGCGRNNFEGGSCEAVRCRFNGVYMARALAERNKRRPRINAGPVYSHKATSHCIISVYSLFSGCQVSM